MPNNLRLTGSFYTSKDGNDANAGTDPNAPKATPGDYGAGTHIWGAGEYKCALNFGASTDTFKGDGVVKISPTTDILFAAACLTKFEDVFFDMNTFDFFVGAGSYSYLYFTRCILKNGALSFQQIVDSRLYLTNSVVADMATTNANARLYTTKTLFFNCSIQIADDKTMTDCYADEASLFSMTTYFTTPATEFKNNNFRGQISVAGTPYELKKNKSGAAINPNPGVADLAVIDATVYDRGNFSEDPLFLNISKGDYWAVSPASPNIFADSTGIGNIGGVFAAVTVKATDPAFASPAANNGLSDVAGGIVWASVPGTRLSQPIQVAASVGKPLKKSVIATLLNFNSSETIGGAENKNVIATQNYTSGTAGANPRRANVIKMRVKSTLPAPVNDASYDNNGYITPGDFFEFEVLGKDTDFMVDTNFKGTGDPAFNPAADPAPIAPVWVQVLLTEQEGIG